MTQEAQLKACPFCGGDAHIYTPPISIGDDITDVDWMRAQCPKCGPSRGFTRFHDHNRQSADFKRARSEAIAAWNTRIESGVVAELVEAAQRIIDGGYVSQHIEEERADYDALTSAIAKLEAIQ